MQKDVALKLADYGFKVNAKTIYNWEKSVSQPNINQFLALCDILGVDDILWRFAGVDKGRYAGLNAAGRSKAIEFIELLLQIEQFRALPSEVKRDGATAVTASHADASNSTSVAFARETAPVASAAVPVASAAAPHPTASETPAPGTLASISDTPSPAPVTVPRMLRLYDIPASAGTGNFLDDSGSVMIEAPGFVPDAVDFALRVSGNSMEPLFRDGQMIWIKKQEVFKHGDIGIFVFAGDVYCKKLIIEGERAFLRSINPEYNDIEIFDDLGFKAIGIVVS